MSAFDDERLNGIRSKWLKSERRRVILFSTVTRGIFKHKQTKDIINLGMKVNFQGLFKT